MIDNMKARYCIWCNKPITNSAHALYCPKCREQARRETRKRVDEKKKLKRRLNKELQNRKTEAFKPVTKLSPASERWAKMSWFDLTKELLHYKMSYPESQVAAKNNTLPEDFGLKRKRCKRCKR